ncbi:MAG: acylphosphatase [Pseudomonadota bacterium]|nr:acylphosphatase [Pseudomonadota bacterium]
MVARRYIVKGKVQGVWFRMSTQEAADRLGLSGWVKNVPGGDVEAVACGPLEQLEELEKWLWQGTADAKVTAVEVEEIDFKCNEVFAIR